VVLEATVLKADGDAASNEGSQQPIRPNNSAHNRTAFANTRVGILAKGEPPRAEPQAVLSLSKGDFELCCRNRGFISENSLGISVLYFTKEARGWAIFNIERIERIERCQVCGFANRPRFWSNHLFKPQPLRL
jgi:hypothetical protein